MKLKRLAKLFALMATLVLSMGMLFSCGDNPDNNGDGPGNTPSDDPEVTVYIAKDGATEYTIVYSENVNGVYDHYFVAQDMLLKIEEYVTTPPADYNFNDKIASGKEILIGATDRALSQELKAAVDAKGEGVWWAYGYKDGNLGYYVNCDEAYELSWDSFISLICKTNTIEVSSKLWEVGGMTTAEYEAYIKEKEDAEAEAERQKIINALKVQINALSPSLMGTVNTEGYYDSSTGLPIYGSTSFTADKLNEHPRVWVNSEDLADIKANLNVAENALMYQRVIAKADLTYTGTLGNLNSSGNINFSVMQDVAKIEALAFMYLVTDDQVYGYTAIRAAKNFLKTVKLRPNQQSWNSDQVYDISNNCGTALSVFAEVYDWCYDLLTQNDKDYIVSGCLNKLTPALEVANPPDNSGCVVGHSTASDILRDWLTFAIAVADEYGYVYNHIMAVMEKYYAPAPNWYYPSGANFQGSAYGINKTYLHMLAEIAVLKATGEKLYNDNVSFEAAVYTYISYLRPDGESIRVGDDYNGTGTGEYRVDPRMAFYGSMYYNQPLMKAWAMKLTDNFNTIGYTGEYLTNLLEMTPIKVLLLNDPNVQYDLATVNDMPLVNFTGAPSTSLIARSAWGDEDAWMTFTNVNEAYGANHDHRDTGTFQIYYKGVLAPDTGAYQYPRNSGQDYGSSYDKTYVKQTISKNGLLIYKYSTDKSNTGGQIGNPDAPQATLDSWLSNGTMASQAVTLGKASALDSNGELVYAYVASDITRAYDSSVVGLVTRTTISINTGNEAHPLLFIVYDRITAKNASYEKSFVLHTTNKPVFGEGFSETAITSAATGKKNWQGFTKVTGTNTFSYDNSLGPIGDYSADDPNDKYNGKLTVTTLLPAEPNYYYVGGEGKHFWLNGINVGRESDTSSYPNVEIGWGRVEIAPSVQQATDSFLNVMYVGDADATGAADAYVPAELVSGSTHEGTVTFGSCVMFAKSSTAVTHNHTTTGAALTSAVQSTLVSSTVSFDTTGKTSESELDYYVTGLKAGRWEVRVGGQLVETVTVKADEAIATFNAAVGEVTLTYQGA